MSRSPLAYPLTRGVDGDAGGAADLQTDIMRFMAILSLCLVAIFALVQSLPVAPDPVAEDTPARAPVAEPDPAPQAPRRPEPAPASVEIPEPVVRRVPPLREPVAEPPPAPATPRPAPTVVDPAPTTPTPEPAEGFTLRFASDRALTRLVAQGEVGFYALEDGRALKLSVRESRLSFWDASLPGAVHEMEVSTVPRPVVDALRISDAGNVRWGVTLPGRLKRRLDALMREHDGGALVIGADGSLSLEAS